MKNKFVADGYRRFLQGKKTTSSESIEKKHGAELANAGSVEKGKIQERMTEEFLRREKAMNHKPSAGTLW
jgi:hypothetical protein